MNSDEAIGFRTSDKAHAMNFGSLPEAAMTDIGDNDTSVIRGPATKKAGRSDSYVSGEFASKFMQAAA